MTKIVRISVSDMLQEYLAVLAATVIVNELRDCMMMMIIIIIITIIQKIRE